MDNIIEATVASPKKVKEKLANKLDISEDFYSVQCEGVTTGVPAYFIRLKGCNLMCGGPSGALMKEGKASWWCDSEYIWKKGVSTPFHRLPQKWEMEGIKEWVYNGRVHLIWTGGEPTIPRHQKTIPSFLKWLYTQDGVKAIYNEIETNGTMYIQDELFENLQQINCSVKLDNSGMRKDKRLVPKALERIMEHENYWFKFVISEENDLKEIEEDFIKPLNIPPTRVLMMPGLDEQKDFHERTQFCLEMAKKYGYVGMTRMHISAWDQTTGV